ncbi:hypothetical protein ACFVSU_07015 [Microbacterium sp. NPDC058062]|uniref:hypothetical protein n=1 Tax=Microbacterium sp. NPDC058062 TaxID=3346320 RepID=UPI0036DDF4E9
MLHEVLHLAAVALAAVAACVHPGWRRKAAAVDLAAVIAMLVAMVNVTYASAPVWSIALLGAAMALAAWRSPRSRRQRTVAPRSCAVPHTALGLVATAAILPLMAGGMPAEVLGHAGHGASAGALVAVVLGVAGCHAGASVLASVREVHTLSRIQHVLMGGTTLLMAATVIA